MPKVQAPDSWASPLGVRIHQGATPSVQRADDVSRSRGGPERLLRLAPAAGFETGAGGRPLIAADSRVVHRKPRNLRRAARLPRSA
jgi:hypothetical protein